MIAASADVPRFVVVELSKILHQITDINIRVVVEVTPPTG